MSGSTAARAAFPLQAARSLVLAAAASVALLISGTAPALAHTGLESTTPEAGATLDTAPAEVRLEFTGTVLELGTEVVVTAGDGSTVSDGSAQVDGATVVQPLAADLPGGTYTVEWRVTSADGHPLSDSFSFTVAAPASSSSAAPGTTTESSEAAPTSEAGPSSADVGEAAATSDTGSSWTPWVVAGAVLVLVAALAVAVLRLRRRA